MCVIGARTALHAWARWIYKQRPCVILHHLLLLLLLLVVPQVALEDSVVTMSTILASRFVAGIRPEVEKVEKQLNVFSDTLDQWVQVRGRVASECSTVLFSTEHTIRLKFLKPSGQALAPAGAVQRSQVSIVQAYKNNMNQRTAV